MKPRVLGIVAITVAVGAVLVSVLDGTPAQLPGVALGSTVLLHAERALALFAVVIAALSVVLQAAPRTAARRVLDVGSALRG
jgi:hypothetical protein